MTTFLTYGQTVRIHCLFADNGDQISGIITSKSFTDQTLYYQTYRNFKTITNYRESLFQILPKSSFDINDEMNKTSKDKQNSLQGRAKTEREQFEDIVMKKKGEDIYFGAEVVFKHIDSEHYICGSHDCAKSGVGAFKIFLSPNLSSEIVFTLLSNRTYEKEGDKIGLKGPIKIYHNKTLCYLSFEQDPIFFDLRLPENKEVKVRSDLFDSEDEAEEIGENVGENYLTEPMNRPFIKKINGLRYELINENTLKRVWRFQEHEPEEAKKTKELITNHDLVYFLHTKDSKYLVPHLNNSTVYLKKRVDEELLGDFFDGVWQLEDLGGSINMYASKLESVHRGRSDDKRKAKIARHMASGKVLIYSERYDQPQLQEESSNTPMQINYSAKQLQESTLVKFQYSKLLMDAVSEDKNEDKSNAHQSEVGHDTSQKIDEPAEIVEDRNKSIKEAYESFFEKSQVKMVTKMEEHGFRIYKLNNEYKKLLLHVLSAQELLSKFTDFIKVKDAGFFRENMNFWLLSQVTNTLKELIAFIYNCEYSAIVGNSPILQRQKLLQEVGMIQLISELLREIDANYTYHQQVLNQSGRQSQFSKLRAIYKLGYQILQSMAKDNRKIKMRISFFLQQYLGQMVKDYNKVAYKSISQILRDNYLAIQKIVNKKIIKKIIQSFIRSPPDPDNLQFLSLFCLCGDRSVKDNQNAIFEEFYNTIDTDEEKAPEPDKFKFREERNSIQINSTISRAHRPSYRTLPELFRDCEGLIEEGHDEQKQRGHWRYFIEYLNLLADVCVHRNFDAQKYVGEILPLKRLVAFLREDIVTQKNLYQPFIRLVHYAHVQNKDYDEIRRITKVKNWNQNQRMDIPVAKTSIKPQLQDILQRIMIYISKINNIHPYDLPELQIILDPDNMLQLRNIETFLEILKSTLNLGFWKTIEYLKKMVPCMLRILKFDISVIKNIKDTKEIEQGKLKLTLKKPEINLLVRCKILAAEILDIILDNENSIRASHMTKLFKDIVQENIDLSNYIKREPDNDLKLRLRNIKDYEKFKPSEKERNIFRENIWKDCLVEMLKERDIFSEVDKNELNPTLILFEISHYRNEVLSNYSLSLLSRVYGQRKEIMDNLSSIIIVSRGNLENLSKRSVDTRGRLLVVASYNVLNIRPDTEEFMELWTDPDEYKTIGVIQELAYLTIQMKRNIHLSDVEARKIYKYESLYPYHESRQHRVDETPGQRTYPIITQKDQNNSLHQSLIKSQDHHLILFQFIKIMKQKPQSDISMKVLHAVYNFLTVMIWNHNENKKDLTYFLRFSKTHLKYNVGCIDFFREMYTNNKSLVKAESEVEEIVDEVVSIANSLELNSFYKSKLMNFLRVLAIFDDKGDTKNQNIIMEVISRYQVASNNKTVFIFNSTKEFSLSDAKYDGWTKEYEMNYKASKERGEKLRISSELTYLYTFFEIFGALIENQNIINLGKCTNMHPYEWLVKLLENARCCWPLIRHLRAYINKLYYSKGREVESQLYDGFIQKDLKNIVQQLDQIVKLKQNYPQISSIRLGCPIRYTYLNSYIFLALQQILLSLHQMLSNQEFVSYLIVVTGSSQKDHHHSHNNIISIIEMIGYLMKKVDGRVINCMMSEVQTMLKGIILTFSKEVLENYETESENKKAAAMKTNQEYIKEEFELKKIYTFNDSKSLWTHLLDWYAFNKQEKNRDRIEKEVQAAAERNKRNMMFGRQEQMDNDNEKENLADIFLLGSIEKKIRIYKKTGTKNFSTTAPSIFQPLKDADEDRIRTFVPRNLVVSKSKNFRLKNQPDLPAEKENILLNSRRKKLCTFFKVNPIFTDFKLQEFYNLCEEFSKVDKFSVKEYGSVVIGRAEVIKSFVEMNQLNPNFLKTDLKLNFLQLLTNSIVSHNQKIYKQKDVQFWYTSDWLGSQKDIKKAQLFLNSCNCAKFICSTIKYNLQNDVTMANCLFQFAIAFLLGGNRQCQDSFIEIFLKDEKNIIFTKLEELIKRYADRVSLVTANRKTDEIRDDNIVSDTYDFYYDTEGIMIRKFRYEEETSEEEKLEDDIISALNKLYRFVQLLCEGNNSRMKNFIRNQVNEDGKVKSNSIDFIDITNIEIRRLFKTLNKRIIALPLSLIYFIYEVTQLPCIDNQIALCKGTFYEDICRVNRELNSDSAKEVAGLDQKENRILLKIYNKCIEMALSCLEGNQDKIFQDLSIKIEPEFLVSVIKYNLENLGFQINWKDPECSYKIMKRLTEIQDKQPTYSLEMQMILKIVSVVLKIESWIVEGKLERENRFIENYIKELESQNMTDLFKFLKHNLLCIEIKTTSKQKIYFPFHPAFNYLSDSTKDRIMFEANRVTLRDKLIGLIKTRKEITNEINYNFYLDHLKPISFLPAIPINSQKIEEFRRYAEIISVIICVVMGFTASVIYYPDEHEIDFSFEKTAKWVLSVLCIVQFGFTTLYTILWTINRSVLAVCKYEEELEEEEKEWKKEEGEDGQGQEENQGEDRNQQQQEQPSSLLSKTFTALRNFLFKSRYIKSFYCLIAYQSDFLGVLIFFIASLLGAFYRIEYFSLHMFFLVTQITLLTNVFQAITINIKLLGLVSLLGLSFIVIFSIFSFNSYVESVYSDDIPMEHCQSVAECIITLYISQEIGNDVSTFHAPRFIFDILYNVFMAMLFGNIISGIMIDTFGELRDTKNSIEKDKKNCCFICGITAEILEKQGITKLNLHYTSKHHLLWNYVFYLYHIFLKKDSKSNDSFTGLEYIILDKNKENEEDVTWMPIEDDEEDEKTIQIKDLVMQVEKCKEKVEMIEMVPIEDGDEG